MAAACEHAVTPWTIAERRESGYTDTDRNLAVELTVDPQNGNVQRRQCSGWVVARAESRPHGLVDDCLRLRRDVARVAAEPRVNALLVIGDGRVCNENLEPDSWHHRGGELGGPATLAVTVKADLPRVDLRLSHHDARRRGSIGGFHGDGGRGGEIPGIHARGRPDTALVEGEHREPQAEVDPLRDALEVAVKRP